MTSLRVVRATVAASAVLLFSSLSSAGLSRPPGCGGGADCAAGLECVTVWAGEYRCAPAHCIGDAQCAPGVVCHTWTDPCSVTDATCMPQSVSLCTPRYLLPCTAASDCGDGFTCEERTGGVFQCVAKPLMCATAAQCPAGWACQSDAVSMPAACDPGANCASDPPPPAPSASCRPPYYGVDSGSSLQNYTMYPPDRPDPPPSYESGMCQMGHAPLSSGALSVLTLLGALLGLKRRRAQR